MAKKEIDVIFSEDLSNTYDKRYIIIDKNTGEVLDDAQGYGYKSKRNAYAAWSYKIKPKKKITKTQKEISKWLSSQHQLLGEIADAIFHDLKSGGSGDFTADNLEHWIQNFGLEKIFEKYTAEEIYEVWEMY